MAEKKEMVVAPVEHDYEIEHAGTKITLPALPEEMSTETAIETLKRKLKDERTELDVHEQIVGHPFDVLVSFNMAMKEIYGWASPVPTPGFFGPTPPDLLTIKTGPKESEKVQVPNGSFKLPNIENMITTHLNFRGNPHSLVITGTVRKKEKRFLTELAAKTREILAEHSIYKAKALRLQCDDDGDVDFNRISFLDTDYIKPGDLILNEDEYGQVEASLWTPIKHTDTCRKHNIPLKRGVLLEGVYGTGKTMTANVTSQVCVDNGWTYILLDDVRGLKETILFAQRYQPCVVFAEDIDRVTEKRDQDGNDLLNVVDGILTKNSQVITVLTTNHVDKINPAMMRPGRFDAVISIRPPEPAAVKRLVRLYGGKLIDEADELAASSEVMAGNIPATIREVVERSKLSMIAHGREKIADEDLRISAVGMAGHLALLNRREEEVSDEEAAGRALKKLLTPMDSDVLEELSSEIYDAKHTMAGSAHAVKEAVSVNLKATKSAAGSVGEKVDRVKDDTNAIRKAVGK